MADNKNPHAGKARASPSPTSSATRTRSATMGPRVSSFKIAAVGDAARNYDYKAHRGNIKTTNLLESVGHLVKSCLGGGIVAIHEAYMHCGLLTALILNVFLGMFVAYCMHVLVKSAQTMYGRLQVPTMSYPDLAEATVATCPFPKLRKYDKCLRYAVDVTIGIDLFGSCCCYAVIIARSLRQLMEGAGYVTEESNPSIRLYIATLLIPCLLICMITSLKYLAPFSIVADVFILLVAIATVVYGLRHADRPIKDFPILKDFGGLLEYLGVCVFSMEGVGVSLPIENNMTTPTDFYLVLILGMSIVTSLVMVIGFFGYYGFGEKAVSPVTLNFPWEPFPICLKVFMILMIWVTFALNFWVPFDLVWHYMKRRHVAAGQPLWLWERVYRAVLVTVVICIAIIFPNVSSFMGLLGSFCLSNMGFIYPAFIQLCVQWEEPGLGYMKWRMVRFVAIVAFGIFLCIVGTYLNAKAMVQKAMETH